MNREEHLMIKLHSIYITLITEYKNSVNTYSSKKEQMMIALNKF